MYHLLVWGKVLGHQNNSPKGYISPLTNTDDSLQNEYVVKCQLWSCFWETAAVKQWAWERDRAWVLFLLGWRWCQMDIVMSKEMISEASRERQDMRREWEQCQEKKRPGQRCRGSCLGWCSLLSINRISNKKSCSQGKHGKPSSPTSQHFDIAHIKSLSLYTRY